MQTMLEYPSWTSCFIVDEEGYVGILEFDETGPVPLGIGQIFPDDLAIGYTEYSEKTKVSDINFTEEQLCELLPPPHKMEDFDAELLFENFIQIAEGKEVEFHRLLELDTDEEVEVLICLSKSKRIYYARFCGVEHFYFPETQGDKEDSIIKKMVENHIIEFVYDKLSLEITETTSDDELHLEKSFDSLPFFYYFQPYDDDYLQQRVHEPEHPVRIEQLSESLQKDVLHVPVKFRECDQLQIAEWFQSAHNAYRAIQIGGKQYSLLTLTDGSEAWVCTDEHETPFKKPHIIEIDDPQQIKRNYDQTH